MRIAHTPLILATLGSLNAYAQTAGAPEPEKVHAVPKELINAVTSVGFDYVVGTASYLTNAGKPLVDQPTAKEIGAANKQLVESYHRSMRDVRFGANQFHGSISVAIVSGTVMASGTTAGVGAVVAVPVGIVASKFNDMARDYLVANVQARAAAALDTGLNKMTVNQRRVMDKLLVERRYEEAERHFNQSTGALTAMRNSVAGDAVAEGVLNKTINSVMAYGSISAIRMAGAAIKKTDSLEADFVKYARNYSAFVKKTDGALRKLEETTSGLKIQVDEIQGEIAGLASETRSNSLQIEIVQQVLFDGQPPEVKLSMLKANALPGLTETQRATMSKALSVQIKQREVVGTVTSVVGYARDLNTIMEAFGHSDPSLRLAISYGNAASQALTSAFSGNYLGAVASVAGLFGGGSPPDPMAKNMAIIMEAFADVNRRLEAVLKLQQETLQAIAVLSNNINILRQETHARFDRVDFELAQLRSAQQQAIWKDLGVCISAYALQDADLVADAPGLKRKRRYDVNNQRFASFDTMFDYVKSQGAKAYACAEYLNDVFHRFRNPDSIAGNPLSLAYAETTLGAPAGVPDYPPVTKIDQEQLPPGAVTLIEYDMPALAYYKSRLYEPSHRVLLHGWFSRLKASPGWGGVANAYAMLTRPSSSVRVLHERVAALDMATAADPFKPCQGVRSLLGRRLQNYLCSDTTVYDEYSEEAGAVERAEELARRKADAFLSKPILRDQLGELIKYALFVAGPRDLVRGDGTFPPYTLSELIESGNDPHGRNLLYGALTVLDVAISQQSMLYGDMTAYFIADILWDEKSLRFRSEARSVDESGVFEDARRLLRNGNNPWLQRNVAMIILKRSQRGCDANDNGIGCQANKFVYDLAMDRFFAVSDGAYAPVGPDALAAASISMRQVFNLHEGAKFVVRDSDVKSGVVIESIPREVFISLDGFDLPLPSRTDWRAGILVYPPLMHARIADRERVGNRLAGYAVLDQHSENQRDAILTLLANYRAVP